MRYIQIILFCFLTLFLNISAAFGENIHVLVNIWDGTERLVIENIYNQGKLPFLASVGPLLYLTSNEDCFDGTCMKTVTKPQHAVMLTGCLADIHGVYTNNIYQLIPDGITVYELIEAANPDIRTAHIAGKPTNVGEPTFGNIIPDVDFFEADNIGSYAVSNLAIDLISQWKDYSFFIVCHFKQPDNTGHIYGKNTSEYRDSIKKNDKQLGRLMTALQANGTNAQTIVYVLSDHGFGCPKPIRHDCSPNTFITTNNVNLSGDIFMKDVAGFLLSHFALLPVCQ